MRWLRDTVFAAVPAAMIAGLSMLCVLAMALTCHRANGQDCQPAKAKATAALAIAQAQREREHLAAAAPCYSDLDQATAAALKANKSLIIWAGMTCSEGPELRKAFGDAVHCHLDLDQVGGRPRVIFRSADGNDYWVLKEKIRPDTIEKIRAKFDGKPPTLTSDKRKAVEISKAAPPRCSVCGPGCTCAGICGCDDPAARALAAQAVAPPPAWWSTSAGQNCSGGT